MFHCHCCHFLPKQQHRSRLGKAARDMYHAALAAENERLPAVRVLSYAPGPLDTAMQAAVRAGPD